MAKLASTRVYGSLIVDDNIYSTGSLSVGAISTPGQLLSTLVTGTAPFSVASTTLNTNLNADLLDGLDLHAGTRNNEVNKVMRTDASGYANFGWINTTSGNTTGTVSDVYVNTNDGYIRKKTLALFKTELGTMPASDVSAWAKKSSLAIGDIPTGTTGTTVALGNHTHSQYLTSFTESDTLATVTSRGNTTTNNLSIGALTLTGSLTSGGGESYSNYVAGADNIILKGNATGVSGLFFESEKNGTAINHPSDYAFIQYHPYGIGGTGGESGRLVIGISDDAITDKIVLNPPGNNDLVVRVGVGTTEHQVWHAANDGTGSGLDADLLDGNHASAFYLATNPSGYTTNTGTVTSVGLSAGTGISISGGPITTSGSITVTNSAPNVTTNLSTTHNATTVVVNSSDGTNATINGATTTTSGVVTNAAQEWAGSKTFRNGVTVKDGVNNGTGTMQYDSTSKTIKFTFA